MILPSLKQRFKQPIALAWPALFACAAMAACSKTPATPDAFVDALVGGGSMCSTLGAAQEFLKIGSTTNPNEPSTVPDGTGTVSVECTVSPSGDGFDLQLGASGPNGGRVTIIGHVTSKGGTVHGSIANNNYGSFSSNSCTLTYEFNRNAVPSGQAISAGEIFGHIECPGATDPNGPQNADGSPVTCDASADFLFSNCAGGNN
jgi:hypothetical protein